jgi:hypothetical protein
VAESSWPSPSNGRVVDDTQYEKLGITTGPSAGVYGDYTSPQLVYGDSSGLQVKVAADRYALVRGHVWWSGSTILTKAIASNSSGSTRVDLVVLQLSRTTWDVTVTIVQGTPGAGAPAATLNTGTTGVFQLVLAQVSVANSASTITAGNVTYVATHIGPGGQLRVPSATALASVPLPHPGMQAVLDTTADIYTRNAANSAWVIGQQVAMTSFTPTLTAATTNPALGTGGSVTAEYAIFNGKLCNFRGAFLFGSSGATFGLGQYLVNLPVQANALGSSTVNSVGSILMKDSSANALYSGICYLGANATLMTFVASSGLVQNSNPFTWAVNDYLTWDITYAIA